MRANNGTITHRVKEGLGVAQERLAGLETEAEKMVQDMIKKGKASRKEVSTFLQKLNTQELLDGNGVREWSGRARLVRDDVGHRLTDLRERVAEFVGIATRDQVADLSRDLEKLSRKLDRVLPGGKKTAPRARV